MTESEAIKVIKSNQPTSGYVLLNEALEMAINALGKHKAKRPIDRCMYKECPTCSNIEIEFCKYCPCCGQRLDWTKENEYYDNFRNPKKSKSNQ